MKERPSLAQAMQAVEVLLSHIGEDANRPGLVETPRRVVFAMSEMLGGYRQNPESLIKTFDDVTSDEMVIVRDIPFTSFCEHHWLPFVGFAHIGYLPDGKVIGLSKIPRLVQMFAKRLQVQERLTSEIVDALDKHLKPKGCGCVIEAVHMCCTARGIKSHETKMATSALRGCFKEPSVKAEFLTLNRLGS